MRNGKLQSTKVKPYVDTLGIPPPQAVDLEQAILGSILTDPSSLLMVISKLIPECFYQEKHQIIFSAILELHKRDMSPDVLIVTDYLRDKGEIDHAGGVMYLMELTSKIVSNKNIMEYSCIVLDKYIMREIIRLSDETKAKAFSGDYDPEAISDTLQTQLLELFNLNGELTYSFAKSLDNAIEKIKLASKGQNAATIKTGFKKIDNTMAFRGRFLCIVAGPEGSGKTKFITSLIRGMLENEKDLAVLWFSMEDDRDEIIRKFLSMDMKKSTRELQNIDYQLTDHDLMEVENLCNNYKRFKIEFYDEVSSITSIIARSKRFAERYKKLKKVIVIDNLGLIESEKEGIIRDDDLAAKIKNMADRTGAFIFIVHHFTKEIARKANLEDGYRPRKEYLKGSTRILDYVQMALFVNLVQNYPDLLAEEKQIELNFINNEEIDFTENNFDQHLWSINSQRDRETQNINDLRIATFMKIKDLINNDEKNAKGKLVTFSYIVQKYTEYSNHIDLKNKPREAKYHEKKAAILTFIIKKMYNENYISSIKSPRSLYLYGNNPNLKHQVDDLFIVESVKNRDNSRLNENLLFRFIADLRYNLFKEV